MNLTNFVQTGGFPVKAERLQELQTAYSIFNQLGNLAGNLTILSGCVVSGISVSDGFVTINNEVLPFKAGTLSPNVIVIETATSKEFKNGEVKLVHLERYASFGTADEFYPWADFVRPIQTKNIPTDLVARLENLEKKAAVFIAGGGMVFWNKPLADIPEGWQEVVNWKGRIPVGYDVAQTEFNTMGKQGGNKSKTLAVNELPKHKFEYKGFRYVGSQGLKFGDNPSFQALFDGINQSNEVGGDVAFSLLNPYRTVLFIEYIG